MLQEIKGFNTYCGPGVLSAITGKSTDECASVIAAISGQRQVTAARVDHITLALKKLGFDSNPVKLVASRLFSVLSNLTEDGIYLVVIPKHIVAVNKQGNNIEFIDNHTKTPINAAASARLTQFVNLVFKVVEKPKPVFLYSEVLVQTQNSPGSQLLFYKFTRFNHYQNPADEVQQTVGYVDSLSPKELKQLAKDLTALAARYDDI